MLRGPTRTPAALRAAALERRLAAAVVSRRLQVRFQVEREPASAGGS